MNLSSEKKIIAILLLVIVAITSTAFIFYNQLKKLNDTSKWVTHTNEVLFQSQLVLSTALDNETGARGYIVTGDKKFLEPLENSEKTIYAVITKLKKLTEDNSKQQQHVSELDRLINNRIQFSNKTVAAREEIGFDTAMALVASGVGKVLMDSIRSIIFKMQVEENALLEIRKSANEREAATLVNIIIINAVLIFVLILIIIIMVLKEIRMLKKNIETLSTA